MKEGFIREVYLRSNPSVDLDLIPEGETVDCCQHTILMSVYDAILDEFCGENKDERFSCNMFMLQSGPQLIEG